MTGKRFRIVLTLLLIAAPFMSYQFALWGHPNAAWVWCDVLNLC